MSVGHGSGLGGGGVPASPRPLNALGAALPVEATAATVCPTWRLAVSLVVPFAYFFQTRGPTAPQKLGWVISYVVPVLGLAIVAHGGAAGAVLAGLMIVAVYSAYEFGYMVNDTRAVRREAAPTLRLTPQASVWIESRLGLALLGRAALGAALLWLLTSLDATQARLALLGWLAIWPLFALYNWLRGRSGIVVYLLLVGLRFALPVWVALRPEGMVAAWPLLWLLFAVPTTFEAAWKPRYGLVWLASPFRSGPRFRVIWYLWLTPAAALAAWITQRPEMWLLTAASGYYLVLRLVALGMHRRGWLLDAHAPTQVVA